MLESLNSDVLQYLFLSLSGLSTATISATLGMGGGVALLSLLTFLLPLSSLVPVHGVAQFASNISRSYLLRNHIKKEIFKPFLFGVPIGSAIAAFLLKGLVNKQFVYILISLLIFYVIFFPKKKYKMVIAYRNFFWVGMISGALGILVGATGPFLAGFFLRDDLNKKEVVASKAACQFIVHLLKFPAFIYLGYDYLSNWPILVTLVIAVIIGTRFGVHILDKVSERLFKMLFKSVLIFAALRLLYKAFF